ncbi:acyltransferase family protein [Streptomyces sp. NPDC059070]|uniref:acyltransferase family protein n=1 Tax=Streptomyces sp. NPDC059070 TaxID=3346713 RepID=UPI00368D762C
MLHPSPARGSSMSTPGSSPDRLRSLTGIRAFAALAVFLPHALSVSGVFAGSAARKAADATIPLATSSVTLFFVLSGLVLTWSAPTRLDANAFRRRRLVRIFPAHLTVWTLAVPLIAGYGISAQMLTVSGPLKPGPALADLFLLQAWYPRYDLMTAVNPVTWSLACELLFYLAFPLLLTLVRRIPRHRLWHCTALTTGIGLSVPCLTLLLDGPDFMPSVPVSLEQLWAPYMFPPSRLPEFVLGMLLARIVMEGMWRPLRLRWILPLPFTAIATLAVLPPVFAFGPYFAAPVAVIIAELASRDARRAPSPLRGRALVFLGDRAFAFYLVHYVVIMYTRHFILGPGTRYGTWAGLGWVFLAFLPLSCAAAWLLHRYVEKPAVDRFSTGRLPHPGLHRRTRQVPGPPPA